jgi:hypothetical protein
VRAIADQLLATAIERLEALQPALPLASTLTQQHELIRETSEYAKFFSTAVSVVNPVPTPGEPEP